MRFGRRSWRPWRSLGCCCCQHAFSVLKVDLGHCTGLANWVSGPYFKKRQSRCAFQCLWGKPVSGLSTGFRTVDQLFEREHESIVIQSAFLCGFVKGLCPCCFVMGGMFGFGACNGCLVSLLFVVFMDRVWRHSQGWNCVQPEVTSLLFADGGVLMTPWNPPTCTFRYWMWNGCDVNQHLQLMSRRQWFSP